jgi:hypothetical protein
VADLALAAPGVAGDAESAAADPGERPHPVGARRVQADQHAQRFEHRGFALGVVAGEDRPGLRHLEIEGLETPEVDQSQRAQHACGRTRNLSSFALLIMKAKTELILYHMFWVADYAMRPSVRRIGESFEQWAYQGGFLRQIRELERQGFLEAEESQKGTKRVLRLTEKGMLRAMGGCDPVERWNRPWDGAWRMVVFDLPETQRKLRSRLRRELLAADFGCLQGSVWITPDALDAVLPSLGEHDIKGGTMCFHIRIDSRKGSA